MHALFYALFEAVLVIQPVSVFSFWLAVFNVPLEHFVEQRVVGVLFLVARNGRGLSVDVANLRASRGRAASGRRARDHAHVVWIIFFLVFLAWWYRWWYVVDTAKAQHLAHFAKFLHMRLFIIGGAALELQGP